jgi:hypothetical protein
MSDINITITLQPEQLYQCLSVMTGQDVKIKYDDQLRDTVVSLLMKCKQHELFNHGADGKNLSSLLLFCAASPKINHDFMRLLDLMKQSYQQHYQVIIDLLNIKQFNTHEELINIIVNDDLSDEFDQKEILSTLKKHKESDVPLDENKLKMLNLLDDETFNNILNTLGLDEAGMSKAKQIKQDIKDNKPLNIPDIMKFIEEYKQTISCSDHPLVGQILNMFGITPESTNHEEKSDKQAPFDFNNLMNMVTPILNGLNQNRQQRRQVVKKRR